MRKRIAIVGCGAIASVIIDAVAKGEISTDVVALMDIYQEKCEFLSKRIGGGARICREIECILESNPHIVVEAASQSAVKEYVTKLVSRGIDVVVLSVGALLDKQLLESIADASKRSKARIYIPSGAIAGVDALKAVSIIGVDKVILKTTKNIAAFDQTTLKLLGVEPSRITQKTKIFSGSAYEAVKLFPFNINVVATLVLATGVEPQVEIYADPTANENIHEIEVYSKISKIHIKISNAPHPQNPRTSYIAALSVVKLLKQLCGESPIHVGT